MPLSNRGAVFCTVGNAGAAFFFFFEKNFFASLDDVSRIWYHINGSIGTAWLHMAPPYVGSGSVEKSCRYFFLHVLMMYRCFDMLKASGWLFDFFHAPTDHSPCMGVPSRTGRLCFWAKILRVYEQSINIYCKSVRLRPQMSRFVPLCPPASAFVSS